MGVVDRHINLALWITINRGTQKRSSVGMPWHQVALKWENRELNTITCTNCGVAIAKSRPSCPNCGRLNPKAKHEPGSVVVLIGVLVVIVIWGMLTKSYAVMIGLLVVTAIMAAVMDSKEKAKKLQGVEWQLDNLDKFTVFQKVLGADGNTGIAIDEARQSVCLIDSRYELPEFRIVPYKNIISCELFQDGSTVTRTIRSSQIGGALVGGIALGGIGVVVAGLSGKTKSSDTVKRIDLRIIVDDTKSPIHDVNFLNVETKKEGLIDGNYYQQSLLKARHWQGLVEVLIKRADSEESAPVAQPGSLAEEIRKLAELRDSGVLTDEEFVSQKAKLLA